MSGPESVRVAAVMLTWNQHERTLRALESLMPQLGRCDRVVVWDNGSTDGTESAVRQAWPGVLVQHHSHNLGVASGRNAGARVAIERFDPEYLLFLDNDLVLRPGYVEALAATLEGEATVGQVQSKLLYLEEPGRINDGGGCRINFWLGRTLPVGHRQLDRGQCDAVTECVSCGGSMMVRARLFRQLGGFDEAFNPFGPEDLDFSLRVTHSGYRALYNPAAVALHEVGHSFARSVQDPHAYAKARMQIWLRFLQRYATPAQRVGYLCIGAPLLAARLAGRELLRGSLGGAIAAIGGIWAGLRGAGRNGSAVR